MQDQTYQDTAHLLRRAGFGASPEDIKAAAARGLAQTTDDLLHPERTPDPIQDDAILTRLADLIPDNKRTAKNGREFLPVPVVKMWWTHRMIASPRPLEEKMTLFWHGHFTSRDGGQQGDLMLRQNQLFRANALGNFRTLTLAVSRDPEMLRYLNGNQNVKAHPNENYGRELMELFTCGIGNYTEDDVKAAARAFSGWNLRAGEFAFNPNQHDNDPKTFLGKTGNWNGDDIVEMLVAHPATARRLCTQLCNFFLYADPEPAVVNALVQSYYDSGYEMKAVLGTLLRSRAFYSDKARYAVIKCPAQYVVGSVKMLGLASSLDVQPADITRDNDMAANSAGAPPNVTAAQKVRGARLGGLALLPNAMRNMGQDILDPPSVKGWDGGPAWINTATLLARINFANALSQSRQAFNGQFMQAAAFVQQNNLSTAAWVDYLAQTLGPLPLSAQTRQALIDYADGADDSAPPAVQNAALDTAAPFRQRRRALRAPFAGREARLRGVIPLIMATPEYQVC